MDDSSIIPFDSGVGSADRGYHRQDSFPTDDVDEGSIFGENDSSPPSDMPTSFSMGAFPVFLLQESPHISFSQTAPQFPESPESTFGFQSSPPASLPRYQQLSNPNETPSPFGEREKHNGPDYFSLGQVLETPKRTPVRIVSDEQYLEQDYGFTLGKHDNDPRARIHFGDDETLVGHCDMSVAGKNPRPMTLRYSSSTSTSLASPLSDTFSPRSTSYSVSTESPYPSPCHPSALGWPEDSSFPVEVGGTVSLDFEVSLPPEQAACTGILELKPVSLRSQADTRVEDLVESCDPVMTASHIALSLVAGPSSDAETVQPVAGAAASVKQATYNQLGHGLAHQTNIQAGSLNLNVAGVNERRIVSSPVASSGYARVAEDGRRRAFSGTREFMGRDLATGHGPRLIVPGRARSSSASSSTSCGLRTTSNDLIEQAARSRSRSNSAAVAVTCTPPRGTPSASTSRTTLNSPNGSRSLNSSASKDSLKARFADLPGYVAFLRDITVELWIDQEGFRAIRPQFQLCRYTPGQQAPVGSGIRLRLRNSPSADSLAGSPVRGANKIPGPAIPSPSPVRQLGTLPGSISDGSISSLSAASPSPTALLFPPQVQSTFEVVEQQAKPQFLENWGVAEFTMSKRQGWHFHHGVADSEPTLRRLTINGVEDRDYLSREASLCVKSNGVYTVKGSEDRGRFEWKFEYLVEDRHGSSGAVIHGEKILTPLSFSCAPELLIPEQGKKVKLLHVMKKGVIPKIHSSKLDPPLVPTPPGRGRNRTEAPMSPHPGSGSTGSKTFEVLAKIVRPSSAKSRPSTPKHVNSHTHSPSQTPVRRSRDADDYGRRRAASYSAMRPDLHKILGSPSQK